MKKIIIVFTLLCSLQYANAQNNGNKDYSTQEPRRGERIKSMHIAMLSNAMNLDEATASKFWPIYNAFANDRKTIREERRGYAETLRNKQGKSDAEIDNALSGIANSNQKELDLQKKYKADFLKVISIQQLATLYDTERKFKEMLIERMGKNKGNERNGGMMQNRRRFGR